MDAVAFEQVSKTYPNTTQAAVNDCTFAMGQGRFVVLLGPSGCGKTTLLKMVNRLVEPDAGVVRVDGQDVRELDATQLRRQIGYVIQQVGLFPHLTVAQNIAVVPELLGWRKDKIQARTEELLELIELPPATYRNRYPGQLSGGQQQRVGLARALAADPKLLLMDEPFGAIDAITRATLQDAMLSIKRALSKAILFVTHDVEEALRLADQIVVMRAGHIVQYDTPARLLSAPVDEFVRELLGADDMVRQLSLRRVSQVMLPLPPQFVLNGMPTVAADADLRTALSELLQAGTPQLAVMEDDLPVGLVGFEEMRGMQGAERRA